jgi:ABC-type sugar transport system ATPase subunit
VNPTPAPTDRSGGASTLAPTLVADSVVKRFGRVEALRGASLEARDGRVTAIIGDNGAGKSTLIKCLAGIHQPDGGRIVLRGEEVTFASPQVARDAGMEVVYQDLALVDSLPVWKNLFLNRERRRRGLLDRSAMREQAREMLQRLDVGLPSVDEEIGNLSGGQRQAVAIARAAGWGSGVVIMDEPTAALGVREGRAVEELIVRLRDEGRCLLVISHNFEQVMRISDHVYVMRQGRVVKDVPTTETTGLDLVSYITGAHLLDDERPPEEP